MRQTGSAPGSLEPGVRIFLAEARVPGVLASIGPSGGPVTSAVWYGLDGDDIVISTPAAGSKARRVRANPRVSFIVDVKERPYHSVAIEGLASVEEDPALEVWTAIARRYQGPELPAAVLARGRAAPRATIRIRPLRARA